MVTKVQVKADIMKGTERFFLVKCEVHASMKKAQYTVYAHLHQDTGKVSYASCSCVTGKGGCCKRVVHYCFKFFTSFSLS